MKHQNEILIVDGGEPVRESLTAILTDAGYGYREARNVEESLVLLGKDSIDLVIMFTGIPGTPDTTSLKEITDSFPDIAIIAVIPTEDTEWITRCIQSGAYDCITEPLKDDIVQLSISRALERRKLLKEVKEYRQHLDDRIIEQSGRIRASFLNTIRAMVYALEAKDEYTSGHSQRVADISAAIARELHLPQESIDKVVLAALVHDLGKIGIKESILNKPDNLTPEELEQIQRHPEIGERIMGPVAEDEEILRFIKHHHSCFDGNGYPDQLKGYQIPLGARILAVADAYEAMTSERPYRKSMSTEDACIELIKCKDKQFDPEVVEAFLRCKDRL